MFLAKNIISVNLQIFQKPRLSPMRSFMQPFKWQLWLTLFTSVFIVGAALYFLDSKSPFLRFVQRPPVVGVDEDDAVRRAVQEGQADIVVNGISINQSINH